ncbi:NAD(+) diphosphatase [Glaciecola siphonariae]|uniref:NAD(+) diphosphatase n=1 Tax=Glaciecola siphonariae TaxID=521012 RepID=A0ABV9LXZ5_9ALTE
MTSTQQTLYFIFSDNRWVVPQSANLGEGLAAVKDLALDAFAQYRQEAVKIAQYDAQSHVLIDMQRDTIDDDNYRSLSMREALGTLNEHEFSMLAKAWQYALFLRHHKYCGRCGSAMLQVQWEMAMHCHSCQHRVYPRVSPCIIVAVRKGDKILLAQGVRHQSTGFFSTLAGFVESAESLEHAVHREVKEEVGIEIKNLEYFGSQPWPFPHSIMVGYLAEYASGDLVLEEKEILSADWFDVDKLPLTPPTLSIAGRLIEETVKRIKQGS